MKKNKKKKKKKGVNPHFLVDYHGIAIMLHCS